MIRDDTYLVGNKFAETHGYRNTKLYTVWRRILMRCYNPKYENYHNYGGRGITVCDEWRYTFPAFKDWAISNGYRENLWIDRKDNDKGYDPSNCRWATPYESHKNRRTTRWLTAFGETKLISDWATDPRCVVAYSTLLYRANQAWMPEEMITKPSKRRM